MRRDLLRFVDSYASLLLLLIANFFLLELVAHFQGPWAQIAGTPHEWWSPRTGVYRADHSSAREGFDAVYDGTSITRRKQGRVFRIEGERAMLRYLVSHESFFELPAIAPVRQYVRGDRSTAMRVTPTRGGRAFGVVFTFHGDTATTQIRYSVEVRSRLTLDEARHRGLLQALEGRVAGQLQQSRPGTAPHFGEAAFWFGSRFGGAHAVTALEQRGGDPVLMDERRGTTYTTMYRLPGPVRRPWYPGLGPQQPIEVRVECRAKEPNQLPGLSSSARGTAIRLADGTRATRYDEPYLQGSRSGVWGDIVVGGTVCFVHGLIPPETFRRLAPTLRRVS